MDKCFPVFEPLDSVRLIVAEKDVISEQTICDKEISADNLSLGNNDFTYITNTGGGVSDKWIINLRIKISLTF